LQGETKTYSDEYIEQCFQCWYAMGQPTNITLLQESIPESPEGKKPGLPLLRQFRDTHGWVERADGLNALAVGKAEVGKSAKEHLLANGFDTSASAVNALKWAQEEERTVRGVSEMMVKISKMTPEELMKEAAKLLKRNSEVVDGETEEYATDLDSTAPTD
jgi:hypothetical protein